jgi:hypothetical protein
MLHQRNNEHKIRGTIQFEPSIKGPRYAHPKHASLRRRRNGEPEHGEPENPLPLGMVEWASREAMNLWRSSQKVKGMKKPLLSSNILDGFEEEDAVK